MERNTSYLASEQNTGLDIRSCKAQIDQEHQQRYATYLNKSDKKRNLLEMRNKAVDCSMTSHNNITAASLDSNRSKKKQKTTTPEHDLSSITVPATSRQGGDSSNSTNKSTFFQLKLHDGPNPTADSRLTMANTDMIHSIGLSFSLTSEPTFQKVLTFSMDCWQRLSCSKLKPNIERVTGFKL
jgi:hypothetical protein